jgi:small subunit ribosomal protein S9
VVATQQRYFYGTGRRKTAVARVRLLPGEGRWIVNGKTMEDYFGQRPNVYAYVQAPLMMTNLLDRFNVSVLVAGGGVTGQGGAVRHGIARALVDFDAELRPVLKRAGFLTRDPRVKERKKVGLKRARKAPQYTKR